MLTGWSYAVARTASSLVGMPVPSQRTMPVIFYIQNYHPYLEAIYCMQISTMLITYQVYVSVDVIKHALPW